VSPVPVLALVRREWKSAWNGPIGYAQRSFYALLLLGGAGFAWGGLLVQGVRARELGEASRAVYHAFFVAQLLLATFLAAVSFARALAREKERRTLELLLLCPLSGFGILLGKTLGQLLEIGAVLAAGLPVLVFLVPLGGMTLGELVSVHLILAGHLAAVGGLAALLASLLRNSYRAMVAVWIGAFGFLLLPRLGRILFPLGSGAWIRLDAVNPLAILGGELASVWTDFPASFVALAGGLGVLLLGCFLGGLVLERRHAAEQERRGEPGTLRKSLRSFRAARLFRPLFPIRHPLTRRECALENDLRFRAGWLVFTAVFAGAVALILASGVRIRIDEEAHNLFILSTLGLVLAAMIVLAAVSVTADKRSGRYEAMLAANVEPEDLVRSRLAGLLLRSYYLLLGPLLYGVTAVLFLAPSWEAGWRLAIGLVGLGFASAIALLLTIGISVQCRGPAWAAALSMVLALPPGLLVGGAVAATPVTFAVGVPLGCAFLLAAYATVVRKFRGAALR